MASAAESFDQSIKYVNNYDSLERSLMEKIGELPFGAPIIYSAAEKQLILPSSIAKTYDVVWIEFPVTLKINSPVDLTEMYVELKLPNGFRVLELLPLTICLETNPSRNCRRQV